MNVQLQPAALRAIYRRGEAAAPTATLAPGFLQANLAVLPACFADDFEAFLHANPMACPLLARGRRGDPILDELGAGIDVRCDLPRYRVFHNGVAVATMGDIAHLWRADLVAFAVGCSLSFEGDLMTGGVTLRCHAPGASCSAFDSSIPAVGKGPFGGNLVVTMRAVPAEQVDAAISISAAHPFAHGAPVHVGDPAEIGVDLSQPIDGIGLTDIRCGEVPVFWACGVTMERAIAAARPEIAITHAPAHMLITDLPARWAGPDNNIRKGERT